MQRYFTDKLKDNVFTLNNDDYYHIKTVMRMNESNNIEVVYQKEVYLCSLEFNDNNIIIHKEKKVDSKELLNKEIILVIPLLKETKMDYILQKATELGVTKIIPVEMERSIIKLDKGKEEKRIERWTRICKEASEQSMRVTIPVITEVKKLTELSDIDGAKMLCSTVEKQNTIKMFLQSIKNYDRIIIVVGPEGGISPKEETLLNEQGFTSVTLGNRIMRVETVPLFVLSTINYEFME